MRRRLAGALLPLVLAAAPAVALAAPRGPVAVLPFKNLNADPDDAWLSAGVAETMVSDLKKSGRVTVVERSQLQAALTEVERSGLSMVDPSTATKVGKMVGARAVIVGSFQRAGERLRFVARIVDVETGVVGETAKVTGPAAHVFDLQDRIVEQLLGIPPPPRRRTRRPASRKRRQARLKAYRLYALSLQVQSDADRARFLKEAVSVDPDFVYATEDLARLGARMKRYRTEREARLGRANEALRAELEAEKDPMLRMQKAVMLLGSDLQEMRYQALVADASAIYEMRWQKPEGVALWTSPKELAASYLVQAHYMLKRYDVALQLGERFMKEFPGSMQFPSVEHLMQSMIRERQAMAEGKAALPAALEAIETERRERIERAKARGREVSSTILASLDLRRCSEATSLKQWERALEICDAFLETWRDDESDAVETRRAVAHFNGIRALAELGRFDEARARVRQMQAEMPEAAKAYNIATLERVWPR